MEQKKSPKADLENKRSIFLLLGLVISLLIVLAAFEWTTKPAEVYSLGELEAFDLEEEYIPITREEIKAKTPPKAAAKVIDIINIVNNDVELEEELFIENTEADFETVIDVKPIVTSIEEEVEEEVEVFFFAEEQPEFPGGQPGLLKYIKDHVNYPVIAQENGVQGRVIVRFVVDEEGSVTNAEIYRSIDPSLDREALRVINTLPKFKPGRQGGNPVKVYYTAPINFILQ